MERPSTRFDVAPVERTHDQARQSYDRMARWYDAMAAPFEGPHLRRLVELLEVRQGEAALDVGFGTGDVVLELARAVGEEGGVVGIDISPQMKEVATAKLEEAGLEERVDLRVGDACKLPFSDASFDVVCSTFTVELFDLSEMEVVLEECRRVLRPAGRFGVAAMSSHRRTVMSAMYEAARKVAPQILDCRPIPVEEILEAAGFELKKVERGAMAGIPVAVVVAEAKVEVRLLP